MSPLLNVWKFFGKLRKKHQRVQKQTFPQVSEIFENLQQSSEKIGKCRKVYKTTFQHFKLFYEIFGNHRKSSDVFGNLRKISETCCKVLKITFQHLKFFSNLRKFLELFGKKSENVGKFSKQSFGNARKTSETLGKFSIVMEAYEKFLYHSNLTSVD